MSRKVRNVLFGAGVVVFAVLVWFFILSPLRGDISDIESQIEDERMQLSQAQIQLQQAEATREEGKRNQARLLELAKMMPGAEEIPSLLLQLQDLADQSGIKFTAITPGDAQPDAGGSYRILPLDLEFKGTFFDVSDFIYRVEQLVAGPGRLLAVKDLSLSLGGGEGELAALVSPELEVSIAMYAFVTGSGQTTPVTTVPANGAATSTPGESEETVQ